jgi:SulP family sulfate permease
MVPPQRRGQRRGRHHAVDALEDLRAELTRRGIVFAMARVKKTSTTRSPKGGFVERVGADRIFLTLPTAIAAFRGWSTERHTGPGSTTDG